MAVERSIFETDGRVIIPRELRDRFGFRPGQIVFVEEEDGKLVLRHPTSAEQADLDADAEEYDRRLQSVVGTLDLGMTVDEWIEELRGPRDLT